MDLDPLELLLILQSERVQNRAQIAAILGEGNTCSTKTGWRILPMSILAASKKRHESTCRRRSKRSLKCSLETRPSAKRCGRTEIKSVLPSLPGATPVSTNLTLALPPVVFHCVERDLVG